MNAPRANESINVMGMLQGLKAICAEGSAEKPATELDEPLPEEVLPLLDAMKNAGGRARCKILEMLSIKERRVLHRYITICERREDLSLLELQKHAGVIVKEAHPSHEDHRGLVEAELALTRHLDFGRILLIGTEIYPMTALLYAHLSGRRVVCYENNLRVSALARDAVSLSKWRDRIEIVGGSPPAAAIRAGGLIVINTGVPLKRSVLKNIRKSGDGSSHILCRTLEYFEPSLHKALRTKSLPGFFPVKALQIEEPEKTNVFLLASHKELVEALEYRWLEYLTDQDKVKILNAMNTIIVKDPGIGYPFPLGEEEGGNFTDALDRSIRSGAKHLLVVEYQKEFAAQAILTPNASLNNKHLAEISRAFVMEPFRGIGLELLALKKIVARAKSLGIKTLILDARGGTNAPKRWKTIGFQVYGVLPNYSYVRGRYYDGIYMYQTVEEFESRFGLRE